MDEHVARLQDTLDYEKARVSCMSLKKKAFMLTNQEASI